MKDFTRITEFSYDSLFIIYTIIGLVFTSISIISFIIFYKKSKRYKKPENAPGKLLAIGFITFILGAPFFVSTISSLPSINKQFAEYEGKFEVVKSNTNIVYSDKDVQKEITLKDKNHHMQVFNVDNNTKYKKGDIVRVKAKVQKGVKPSLQYKINPNNDNLNNKQTLISIKKVDK